MTTPRLFLFVSILLLPVISVRATSHYEYGPDDYVTVTKGMFATYPLKIAKNYIS